MLLSVSVNVESSLPSPFDLSRESSDFASDDAERLCLHETVSHAESSVTMGEPRRQEARIDIPVCWSKISHCRVLQIG